MIRFHGSQLDAAILRDRRDTSSQAAGEADENVFDWSNGVIFRGENLRMIRPERGLLLVALFLPESEEALDL